EERLPVSTSILGLAAGAAFARSYDATATDTTQTAEYRNYTANSNPTSDLDALTEIQLDALSAQLGTIDPEESTSENIYTARDNDTTPEITSIFDTESSVGLTQQFGDDLLFTQDGLFNQDFHVGIFDYQPDTPSCVIGPDNASSNASTNGNTSESANLSIGGANVTLSDEVPTNRPESNNDFYLRNADELGYSELPNFGTSDDSGPSYACGCGPGGGTSTGVKISTACLYGGYTIASACSDGSMRASWNSSTSQYTYLPSDQKYSILQVDNISKFTTTYTLTASATFEIQYTSNKADETGNVAADYWTSETTGNTGTTTTKVFTWTKPAGVKNEDAHREFTFNYIVNGAAEMTFYVTVVCDTVTPSWQSNLGGNPAENGGGVRVFPEKPTPTSTVQNTVSLNFNVNYAIAMDRVMYFKILDPENYANIKNGTSSQTFNGGDNNWKPANLYGKIIEVTIPAGKKTAPYTLTISDGYAGDNFIVAASFTKARVEAAKLGTTLTTWNKLDQPAADTDVKQTSLLTVWRTLWIELDQMAMPTATAADGFDPANQGNGNGQWNYTVPTPEPTDFDVLFQPQKPDISLLTTAMVAACITVKEIDQTDFINFNPTNWITNDSQTQAAGTWDTTTPFVHNMGKNFQNVSAACRDIPLAQVTPSFWLVHGIGAYEDDRASGLATFTSDGGSFYIFAESIRGVVSKYIPPANNPSQNFVGGVSGQIDRATYHEVMHFFGLTDVFDVNAIYSYLYINQWYEGSIEDFLNQLNNDYNGNVHIFISNEFSMLSGYLLIHYADDPNQGIMNYNSGNFSSQDSILLKPHQIKQIQSTAKPEPFF
ncbi:MAG: hypothetical protein ACRC2T_18005, partial [Thermoguttaceae bacterium]